MQDDTIIFSPYSLNSPYWIILEGAPFGAIMHAKATPLYQQPNLMGMCVDANWVKAWNALINEFPQLLPENTVRASVIPAETLPSLQEIQLSLKPLTEIQSIAQNIWLAHYLGEGRLVCYLQPVVNRSGIISGYEAFARIDAPGGTLINGGDIMQASRALRLEYQVDRLMHKQAVQKFMAHQLQGTLFINFLANFIHLPQIYLAGLAEAMDRYNVPAGVVALDVPPSSYSHDSIKLKSIAQHCREKGVLLAFDDIGTHDGVADVLAKVKPEFIKLDASLTSTIATPATQAKVKKIVDHAHGFGSKVIAETVENSAQHAAYRELSVDLFQGYHFGAPERIPIKVL